MGRFFIYANRDSGTIGGAVSSKSIADDIIGQLMGNDVIKPQPNPLKHLRDGYRYTWDRHSTAGCNT